MKEPVLTTALAVVATACLSEAIYFMFPNGLLCRAIQAPKHFVTRFYIYAILFVSFAGVQYIATL